MAIDLRRVLSSDNLPSLPNVAVKVLEIVRSPEPDVHRVITLVKSDPALAAKILRTANSSLFGVRQQVTTIEQAVPLLGTVTVNSLVLSFSLTAHSMHPGPIAEHFQRFWRGAITQAAAADRLARLDHVGVSAEYFVAGLLQDVGVLALLRTIPDEYVPILDREAIEPDKNLAQIELEDLGMTHVDVSVELCRRWKLPATVIEAVAMHHEPPARFRQTSGGAARLAVALATAANIAQYFCRDAKHAARLAVEELADKHYKLSGEPLRSVLDAIDVHVREAADLFTLDLGACPPFDEILSQANDELLQIALRAQQSSLAADASAQAARRELTASEKEKDEIRLQSYRDRLTSAFSRQFFDMALERECCRSLRYHESLGLVFVDVDHFKNLNDSYGHLFGDEVLKHVVASIQSAVRDSDFVARFGGEEFVVLLLRVSEPDLLRAAERIRQSIASLALRHDDQPVPVTASVGASLLSTQDREGTVHLRLLNAADSAMYEAKRSGRNQVRFLACA